jgi:hypothetical protein
MQTHFFKQTEYVVYETSKTTLNPNQGLKVGHPVAHYDDYSLMIDHWLVEFTDGTHNFFTMEAA